MARRSVLYATCGILALIHIATAQEGQGLQDITSFEGCGPGPNMQPDMTTCLLRNIIAPNGTDSYFFNVPKGRPTEPYSVLLTLKTVSGTAEM